MSIAEQPKCHDAKGACTACATAKAPMTVFASKSVSEHLVRGVLGLTCLYVGYQLIAPSESWLAFGGGFVFLGLSLWALRGCPLCWSVGLINTVAGILHRKQEARNG
jgi:hypothetical protein